MANRLSGKVVLITGSSRGLGLQLAREMAQRGTRLVLLDLPNTSWDKVCEELKGLGASSVYTGTADVTSETDIKSAVAQAEDVHGCIDVLIANAGVGLSTLVHPFDLKSIHVQCAVNFLGVANTIAAVLPGMIRRKSGHIVSTVSISSYRGLPNMAGYCASKAAAAALMDSMRVDLKPYGIRCTTLNPGWINTGVIHTIDAAKPGVTDLATAGRKLAWAIERQKPYICFPAWMRMLFILNRLQPTNWGDWMLMQFWRWFGGTVPNTK
ncbi:MAG TPA: SDR family NAD(P)-dependent oxidoreductase [Gemmatales bacterium]|nr:SDR family NAD(P)-dependent oxidoreductase [Gemmatales bacterium]HMP15918.1 SDR family NAD(P)-dependent oxidoreductase [Gemmatales bacterium]